MAQVKSRQIGSPNVLHLLFPSIFLLDWAAIQAEPRQGINKKIKCMYIRRHKHRLHIQSTDQPVASCLSSHDPQQADPHGKQTNKYRSGVHGWVVWAKCRGTWVRSLILTFHTPHLLSTTTLLINNPAQIAVKSKRKKNRKGQKISV